MRAFLITLLPSALASVIFAQPAWKVPRLADGHPDLTGTYDLATLTPLERPRGQNATLTKEEVKKLEVASADRRSRSDVPLSADRSAPPVGGVGNAPVGPLAQLALTTVSG